MDASELDSPLPGQRKRPLYVGSSPPSRSPPPFAALATTQSKRVRLGPSLDEFGQVSDDLKNQVRYEFAGTDDISIAVMRVIASTLCAIDHDKDASMVDPLWLKPDKYTAVLEHLSDVQSGTWLFAPCSFRYSSGWSLCYVAVTD